ncbi:primosomal protein N' [Heliorestis acidaminivorans]|uniref:Replication restart protein PriA n=1 Tax=Heliorestis acidaminivorans TaxID=553427 RepID=A0A6I0EVP3_9FIRM|nr:primosomal protein N' [Heliorestis acidaminivorans]KAB2954474.1 primosomal protein N' [Heliorestis acidaminivorans]
MKEEDSTKQSLAQVIIDSTHSNLDRPFHYFIPEEMRALVAPGIEVYVPFNHRVIRGWIMAIDDELPDHIAYHSLQKIVAVNEQYRLQKDLISLVPWLSETLLCSQSEVLKAIAPVGVEKKLQEWIFLPEKLSKEQLYLWQGLDPDSAEILTRLNNAAGRKIKKKTLLTNKSENTSIALQRLLKDRLVEVKKILSSGKRSSPKSSSSKIIVEEPRKHQLTLEQAKVLKEIEKSMQEKIFRIFLLHGVTGSGKTEVYIEAAKKVLARHQQVLYLVPEIALTPQTGRRLMERFGSSKVVVLHSALPEAVRRKEWQRIASGEVEIVIGARSAVFAPLPDLGLVIVDEEHEPSYRQEKDPKYHARDVAIQRATIHGATVLLGSATPSLESYEKAKRGLYSILELKNRARGQSMPIVEIVDMRHELSEGHKGMISRPLHKAIEERLRRQEQVILYLNRRGFSTFVLCRECGHIVNCSRCSISMVYHRSGEKLHCHYCQKKEAVPTTCPQCRSKSIRFFGTGTQKIEAELMNLYPEVPILRMDRDVAQQSGSMEEVIDKFARGEAPILIGTQMIAKGLDFPRVTLVGVLSADASLHVSDFRAAERTFQLLSQVAGRAGRAEKIGEVFLQSYCPEHYCLEAVKNHDYLSFYYREIQIRHQLGYPPYSRLAQFLFTGAEDEEVQSAAQNWTEILNHISKEVNIPLDVWGPAPASIHRVEERFRWMVTARLEGTGTDLLRYLIRLTKHSYQEQKRKPKGVALSISIDSSDL